jgi:hypothetical protein
MKKIIFVFCLTLFITGIAAAGGGGGEATGTRTMFVAVNTAELKSGTGVFASTVANLNYGDRVTVLQTSGRFAEVRSDANPSLRGWTAEANLTSRQVVPGAADGATGREVAMAARGFNQEVENSFRNQNQNLNFAGVDSVEALTIDINELRLFLEEGRLAMGDN